MKKSVTIVIRTLSEDHPAYRNGKYFVGYEAILPSGQASRARRQFHRQSAAQNEVKRLVGKFKKNGYTIHLGGRGDVTKDNGKGSIG
jgi:hypothetical protein